MFKLEFHSTFPQYFADCTNPFQDSDAPIRSLTEKQNYLWKTLFYLFASPIVHTAKEEKAFQIKHGYFC